MPQHYFLFPKHRKRSTASSMSLLIHVDILKIVKPPCSLALPILPPPPKLGPEIYKRNVKN